MKILKELKTDKKMTVDSKVSIKEAMSVMYENRNGCVILIENNKSKGILTESDIINAIKNNILVTDSALNIAKIDLITADDNRPLEYAFDILVQYNIRRIILLDKDKNFSGVILQSELFDYLEEDVYKIDLKIKNIINKSTKLKTINRNNSIKEVIELMQEFKIGSLIVVDNNKCVGILTEKDILRIHYNEIKLEEKVSLHMTSPVITLNQNIFVSDVIDVMKLKDIRRIVITNEDNIPISIITNRDILKHIKGNYTKTLENKIKHAQEIMNFLPEPIVEVYYTHDEDIIHWVNTQAQNIFGKNIIDKNITNIIQKKDWKYIKNLLKNKEILKNLNITIKDKIFEISGSLMNSSDNNYIKLLFKDVTNHELEKIELQQIIETEITKRIDSEYLMMQQSKLATMGEMIGHIAHQWRQPLGRLGGIFLNIQTASSFDDLDKEYLQKKLDTCNNIITYMSNTIEDFQYFFKPTKDKEIFDICKYINNAINLITASLTYNQIKVKFKESNNKFFIQGFHSEFAQVVLNILSNANDVLVLNKIKKPYIEIKIRDNDDNIFIDIKDNGGGIDDKIIDKIFNIYFTTKTKEEGTGLGLYMSKLIIETKFDGKLYVKNSKNGAIFTIKFAKMRCNL